MNQFEYEKYIFNNIEKDEEIALLKQKILELESHKQPTLKIVTENDESFYLKIGDEVSGDINHDLMVGVV